MIFLSPHPLLLFETFPEASQFARQIARRRDGVISLWPDVRGWVVENPVAQCRSEQFEEHVPYLSEDSYAADLEYVARERAADDPQFPSDDAYSVDGSLDEEWMLDHG